MTTSPKIPVNGDPGKTWSFFNMLQKLSQTWERLRDLIDNVLKYFYDNNRSRLSDSKRKTKHWRKTWKNMQLSITIIFYQFGYRRPTDPKKPLSHVEAGAISSREHRWINNSSAIDKCPLQYTYCTDLEDSLLIYQQDCDGERSKSVTYFTQEDRLIGNKTGRRTKKEQLDSGRLLAIERMHYSFAPAPSPKAVTQTVRGSKTNTDAKNGRYPDNVRIMPKMKSWLNHPHKLNLYAEILFWQQCKHNFLSLMELWRKIFS